MSHCPITYDPIADGTNYSPRGLRILHSRLAQLEPLPFTETQIIQEAAARASNMSVKWVQPKLSAVLRLREGRFDLVDQYGRFSLKPPSGAYPHIPENED